MRDAIEQALAYYDYLLTCLWEAPDHEHCEAPGTRDEDGDPIDCCVNCRLMHAVGYLDEDDT